MEEKTITTWAFTGRLLNAYTEYTQLFNTEGVYELLALEPVNRPTALKLLPAIRFGAERLPSSAGDRLR